MDSTADIICRLNEALAARDGRAVSTLSRITSGSGDTVRRLRGGRRITTERAARIIGRISEIWPADLPWPTDIPRPASRAAERAE